MKTPDASATLTDPPTPGTPAPPAITTLNLNGTIQTVDTNGVFTAKSGDLVEIGASPDVVWTSASNVPGAVVLQEASSTGSVWKAHLVNATKTEQLFTITATSGSASGQRKTFVLKVAAEEADGDEYRVFSGNGTTLKLAIDLVTQTYRFSGLQETGWTTWSRSGKFEAVASEPGTYVFKDTMMLQSKFRVAADTLVGAYSLPVPDQPGVFHTAPFVATRATAVAAADVDGIYNRAEETLTPVKGGLPGLSAKAHQVRVSAGATKLEMCDDGFFVITRIASCAAIISYTGTGVASGGTWTFVNDADATDVQRFSVAKIGTEKALLRAGKAGAVRVFQVGLPEQLAWAAPVEAIGGDDRGGWGTYGLGVSDFSLNTVDYAGATQSTTFPYYFHPLAADDPIGMHRVKETVSYFIVIQSPVLMVKMMGSWSGFGGYAYVGLIK